jgi:pimeloyl-ACP methyl ester carboxylesterase
VTAIHGDYDPHPADGVRIPLEARLPDFRLILLRHCGHTPWRERQAKTEFYRLLRLEIGGTGG